MKKYVRDLRVTENIRLHENYVLIKLTDSIPLPKCSPGSLLRFGWTTLQQPFSVVPYL